jgi:hypothetical protein
MTMRALLASVVAVVAVSAAAPAAAQYYGGGSGYGDDIVRCESNDRRYRECAVGGGDVRLVRQLSRATCIEGRTWGHQRGNIWVSDGCRAEFRVMGSYGYGNHDDDRDDGRYGDGYGNRYGQTIRCESNDRRPRECAVDTRGGVQLVRQLSKAACIQGRTWGYGRSGIWVTDGCRAEFMVDRRSNGGGWNPPGDGYGPVTGSQLFRCESIDRRVRECPANTRAGVHLVRQLSRAACIQGRTWGYGRGGVWVSDGCRAEFRAY